MLGGVSDSHADTHTHTHKNTLNNTHVINTHFIYTHIRKHKHRYPYTHTDEHTAEDTVPTCSLSIAHTQTHTHTQSTHLEQHLSFAVRLQLQGWEKTEQNRVSNGVCGCSSYMEPSKLYHSPYHTHTPIDTK